MPEISAFRGLRYDPGHVGSLSGVIAMAEDVAHPERANELYKQHPANCIRIVRNRMEPGDEPNEQFSRAARFFKNWQREGVLQREPDPAIYAWHQVPNGEGDPIQRGFLCRCRIDANDGIVPIAASDADRRAEHVELIRTCEANIVPVDCLFEDDSNEVQPLLDEAIRGVAPVEATDRNDKTYRLWPVTDIHIINAVTSAMASRRTYLVGEREPYDAAREYLVANPSDDLRHGKNRLLVSFRAIDDVLVEDALQRAASGEEVDIASVPESYLPYGLVFSSHDA